MVSILRLGVSEKIEIIDKPMEQLSSSAILSDDDQVCEWIQADDSFDINNLIIRSKCIQRVTPCLQYCRTLTYVAIKFGHLHWYDDFVTQCSLTEKVSLPKLFEFFTQINHFIQELPSSVDELTFSLFDDVDSIIQHEWDIPSELIRLPSQLIAFTAPYFSKSMLSNYDTSELTNLHVYKVPKSFPSKLSLLEIDKAVWLSDFCELFIKTCLKHLQCIIVHMCYVNDDDVYLLNSFTQTLPSLTHVRLNIIYSGEKQYKDVIKLPPQIQILELLFQKASMTKLLQYADYLAQSETQFPNLRIISFQFISPNAINTDVVVYVRRLGSLMIDISSIPPLNSENIPVSLDDAFSNNGFGSKLQIWKSHKNDKKIG